MGVKAMEIRVDRLRQACNLFAPAVAKCRSALSITKNVTSDRGQPSKPIWKSRSQRRFRKPKRADLPCSLTKLRDPLAYHPRYEASSLQMTDSVVEGGGLPSRVR